MHATDMRQHGETDDRIFGVAAWKDTPYFTDDERAALALALTEHATRPADQSDPVRDAIFDAAAEQFSEQQLSGLCKSPRSTRETG